MSISHFDLAAAARTEMLHEGFNPDFVPGTELQLAQIRAASAQRVQAGNGAADLRELLWSSIDNDSSRDLDQIEYAESVEGGIRVLVAIADVDVAVAKGSPIDQHAAEQTTSVYTPATVFPMLPEQLSTGLTSLNENEDRAAVVTEFVVDAQGKIQEHSIYRAIVRNKAQLAYPSVGAWLEQRADAPPKVAASAELQSQLKLQDKAAQSLRKLRVQCGALNFDRPESHATVDASGAVLNYGATQKTRANDLIEDFMIATNEIMARTLQAAHRSSIRRVVKTPERWERIVALAKEKGASLPAEADSGALNQFLEAQHKSDPDHYPDLSLAIIKLMGPGEYVLLRAGEEGDGHFGLAAHDYTHSTAPNRRFSDIVTQRLLKALKQNAPSPYSDDELAEIAENCTQKENAARKVERFSLKAAAAVALHNRIGQQFNAIVTGVSDKGIFARLVSPPVDGRIIRGQQGLDVGDRTRVTLLGTNPQLGFIDFGR